MHLELVTDNSKRIQTPTPGVFYTELLNECRADLERDLEYYSQRLCATDGANTAAPGSLAAIYAAHARHIRGLLDSIAA